MKITPDQYTTLKAIADDVASARMAPKHLERFVKIVVQDDGKDRIVQKFSPDATRAAILCHMVDAVEMGLSPFNKMNIHPEPVKPKAIEDTSQEPDVFTAEALAKIPAGKPDPATLARPKKPSIVKQLQDAVARKEGDYWIDDKGRHWKMIDGKKRQQKKPKVDPVGQ